jgi:lysyl-tRNA synthetase class II
VHEAVSAATGEEVTPDSALPRLRALCARLDVPVEPHWNRGQIVLEMYERLVEKQTVTPTFYRDFPVEVSPLTRAHRSVPGVAERWDLVMSGMELGTAYSELARPGRRPAADGAHRGERQGHDPVPAHPACGSLSSSVTRSAGRPWVSRRNS